MRIPILILGFKGLSLVLICSCDSAVSTDRNTAPIYENIRCRPKKQCGSSPPASLSSWTWFNFAGNVIPIFIPGAGKTYTMMGTDQDPGVNIRSILELLRVCEGRTNVDYSMCVSMVEVYNETVRDLLSDNSSAQQLNIIMRSKQLVITDVTEVVVKSASDIKSIMQKGNTLIWETCMWNLHITKTEKTGKICLL